VMKPGHITMTLTTKDSLWNNAAKDHQCKRNAKSKPLLEKSY
jgi:hypothetical protein